MPAFRKGPHTDAALKQYEACALLPAIATAFSSGETDGMARALPGGSMNTPKEPTYSVRHQPAGVCPGCAHSLLAHIAAFPCPLVSIRRRGLGVPLSVSPRGPWHLSVTESVVLPPR